MPNVKLNRLPEDFPISTIVNQPFRYKDVELIPHASRACLNSGCYFDKGSDSDDDKGNCKLSDRQISCSLTDRSDKTSVIFLTYTEWVKRRMKSEA